MAPVWSFIGNSVHEVFYESLSEKNVTDGLVGRLTLIERPVSQKLPDFNRAHKEVKLDPALVRHRTEMVKFAYGHEQQEEHSHNWIDVPMSPEAERWDHVFVAMIQQKKEHHNQAQQGVLVGIWQRVRERTLKLAALAAIYEAWMTGGPALISKANMKWDRDMVRRGNKVLLDRFKSGDVGSDDNPQKRENALRVCLDKFLETPWEKLMQSNYSVSEIMKTMFIVSHRYLQKMLAPLKEFKNARDPKRALDDTIKSFLDAGRIQEIGANHPARSHMGRAGRMYQVLEYKGQDWTSVDVNWKAGE